jgi:hypothetical protein
MGMDVLRASSKLLVVVSSDKSKKVSFCNHSNRLNARTKPSISLYTFRYRIVAAKALRMLQVASERDKSESLVLADSRKGAKTTCVALAWLLQTGTQWSCMV